MGILVVTNRFELGMLDESITKTRGLAIGSPEMRDAQNLFAEYVNRQYHNVYVEMYSKGTYESNHETFFYHKSLNILARRQVFFINPTFNYTSHIFEEGDHIMVIKTSYDPVFTEEDFDTDLHVKVYLFSF